MPFLWLEKYYIPWVKRSLNLHLKAGLVDNSDDTFDYRYAVGQWRLNRAHLAQYPPHVDRPTEDSLIRANQKNPEYVRWVQRCLTISGEDPYLPVNGVWNSATKEAVELFQENEMGLKQADGVVGPRTDAALFLRTNITPPGRQTKPNPGGGVIWIDPPEAPDDTDKPYWKKRTSCWWGIGVKVGGQAPVETGDKPNDTFRALMFNSGNPNCTFMVESIGRRYGVGTGAGAGWVLVYMSGLWFPTHLNSIETGGMDFNLALAVKWGSIVRGVAKAKSFYKIAQASRMGRAFLDSDVSAFIEVAKAAAEIAGVDPESTKLDVKFVDLPALGTGAEASIFYRINSYQVYKVHLEG